MFKKWLSVIVIMTFAASAFGAKNDKSIQIKGSDTMVNLGQAWAELFMEKNPSDFVAVTGGGSGTGLSSLISGTCDIAMSSRNIKAKEIVLAQKKGVNPNEIKVALDGLAVVVNPKNPIEKLTMDQLAGIFTGRIKNWKELGGTDMPIVVISRDTSSGTYETFHTLIMGKEQMAANVEYVNSNPQAHTRVKTTKGAIAYVGIGFVDANVKALKIDGILPTKKTISSGAYPLSRPLFLFTNGFPKLGSTTHKFSAFYLTEKGQEIIEAKGFVPLTNY